MMALSTVADSTMFYDTGDSGAWLVLNKFIKQYVAQGSDTLVHTIEFNIPASTDDTTGTYGAFWLELRIDLIPGYTAADFADVRLIDLLEFYEILTNKDVLIARGRTTASHDITYKVMKDNTVERRAEHSEIISKATSGKTYDQLYLTTMLVLPHSVHKKANLAMRPYDDDNWKLRLRYSTKNTTGNAAINWVTKIEKHTSHIQSCITMKKIMCENDDATDTLTPHLNNFRCAFEEHIFDIEAGKRNIELSCPFAIKSFVSHVWLVDLEKYNGRTGTVYKSITARVGSNLFMNTNSIDDVTNTIYPQFCDKAKGIYFLGPFEPRDIEFSFGRPAKTELKLSVRFETKEALIKTTKYSVVVFFKTSIAKKSSNM